LSLFNELKRRNVIRVSMAYLAGAWLILQVADTVIPWLELGDAVGRILLIVLIVGFVPAVIATWMFEWTPDGIRFDDEVEVDAAGAAWIASSSEFWRSRWSISPLTSSCSMSANPTPPTVTGR
jgi:hypothetical protein